MRPAEWPVTGWPTIATGLAGSALQVARKAMRISWQNVVFSILVLAALVPAALAGVLSIAPAVVVHETSELLVVANGLRAGRG